MAVGAAIGTVAERIPACQSLTVLEYDAGLVPHLRKRLPRVQVIQGDALAVLPTLCFDVLVSNLPSKWTPALVALLPRLDFRVALVTVSSIDSVALWRKLSRLEAIAILEPDDFRPRQPARAEVIKVTPVSRDTLAR